MPTRYREAVLASWDRNNTHPLPRGGTGLMGPHLAPTLMCADVATRPKFP
jgi:hypothetical protein